MVLLNANNLMHSKSKSSPVELGDELDERILAELAADDVGLIDLDFERVVVRGAALHVALQQVVG